MVTNVQVKKVTKLSELVALLTEGHEIGTRTWGDLTSSHRHSNGETAAEGISDMELMHWLCKPEGQVILAEGTHTGNCVGDNTAVITAVKMYGMYFVQKQWHGETEAQLLYVITK